MVAVGSVEAAFKLPWGAWGVWWEVGGSYHPRESWMPEHRAHPDWSPFLRILSAEQSSDKACFADIKKKKHPAPFRGRHLWK